MYDVATLSSHFAFFLLIGTDWSQKQRSWWHNLSFQADRYRCPYGVDIVKQFNLKVVRN
jgi:hypothetical protein